MLSCHCLAPHRAGRTATRFYDAALAPAGLTVAQFAMLRQLQALGRVGISHAARAMQLDRTTLGRNLGPLERAGLVRTVAGETDGRQRMIEVSEAGQQPVRQAIPAWKAAQAAIDGKLDPGRLALLHELLVEFERIAS